MCLNDGTRLVRVVILGLIRVTLAEWVAAHAPCGARGRGLSAIGSALYKASLNREAGRTSCRTGCIAARTSSPDVGYDAPVVPSAGSTR